MADGFQLAGFCYANESQAQDAFFGGLPPKYISNNGNNGNMFIYKYIPDGGVWKLQKTTLNKSQGTLSLNYTISVPQPSFNVCTLTNDPYTNFMDGNYLGWAVSLVMIATFVIRRVYR